MRILKYLALAVIALPILALIIVGIGAAITFDRSGAYTDSAAALPLFDRAGATPNGLVQIGAGGLTFRARVTGFTESVDSNDDKNVILLHGFPETSIMWEPLIDALGAAGYRVVAFDQRGYSPGARPEDTSEYQTPQLVGDVLTVAQVVGFERFHLVGHDWGSAVGWATTMAVPEQVLTYNALSIPHVAAFGEAMANDPVQRERSSYMAFFAMPWLPQRLFVFSDFNMMRSMYATHSERTVDEYLALFAEPGALSAALNWYRAAAFGEADNDGGGNDGEGNDGLNPNIQLPVQFIWGNQDQAVSPVGVDLQRKYLKGEYREIELDAGHWLMEDEGPVVVERIVDFITNRS